MTTSIEERVYILGENTVEQTIINGKPTFERPADNYDNTWVGVYKDEE